MDAETTAVGEDVRNPPGRPVFRRRIAKNPRGMIWSQSLGGMVRNLLANHAERPFPRYIARENDRTNRHS